MNMNMTMDAEMIFDMQMTITTSTTVGEFLFPGWGATNGWQFFGLILFTVAICLCVEIMGSLLKKLEMATGEGGSGMLRLFSFFVFVILRSLNYLQMLIVMTYNIWFIVTLVAASGLFSLIFGIMQDKAFLKAI